jgi:signal transduction histidine kinase
MKSTRACIKGLLLLGLWLPASAGLCGTYDPEYPETKRLVALVQRAADLVGRQEEAAFGAFRQHGSEWFRGDDYVFVIDPDGVNLCLPTQPELEGQNLLDLKDVNGKSIVRSHLRAVSGEGRAGWSHYQWPRPGQTEPAWKSSYLIRVTALSGREYIVGSGIYPTRTERMFVVDTVEAAAALLKQQGEASFSSFRDPAGDFLFGDVYVFVLNWTGTVLVQPASPEREGMNGLDFQDSNGKWYVREMFRVLETANSGWVDYLRPRPGATEPSLKSGYVRKVDVNGTLYLVGSGAYLNETPH